MEERVVEELKLGLINPHRKIRLLEEPSTHAYRDMDDWWDSGAPGCS
jgi:hypothetical protein